MASIRAPAPSLNLLRFLRSQSDHLACLSSSHAPARTLRGTAGRLWCALKESHDAAVPTGRTRLSRRVASLQAGMLDFQKLLPPPPGRTVQTTNSLQSPPGHSLRFSSSNCDPTSANPPPPYRLSWQERIWGSTARRGARPLKPDDLPDPDGEGESNSMFNLRRQPSQKAALEPRLRCTEVDENGDVIVVDGEFKKTELIARFGLLPRDLRKIDSSNLPHILVRSSAILLNLLHLKVLITHDRVMLFDVYGSKASYPQSAFMYDLQGKLSQKTSIANGGLPYEFRALEAVLQSVTQELETEYEAIRAPVSRILDELEYDIDRHKLRILLVLSKRLSTFEQKAKLVRDAIEDLLEEDRDLSDMYLTEKTRDLQRDLDDHTEVELLLESYHKLCDEVVQEASNLVSSIRNTEEIARAILDANRNELMILELKFTIGSLGLAMGTFIAGLYGMNLENFIEETNYGFAAVTVISVIGSLWLGRWAARKLGKLQQIRMGGDERKSLENSYGWFHNEGGMGLVDPRGRERLKRLKAKTEQATKKGKRW